MNKPKTKNCVRCGIRTTQYEMIKPRNQRTRYYCIECFKRVINYWGKEYGKEKP